MSTMGTARQWIKIHERETIYILLIILGIIPYLWPAGLPITIADSTRAFYDTVENLPEGSKVLVIYGWGSGSWGELGGGSIGLNKHLATKNVKLIFCSLSLEGPLLVDKIVEQTRVGTKTGREALGNYGEDWIHLGFLPGGETALAAIMASPDGFHKSYGRLDYYGSSFDNLPLMDEVLDHSSIDLCIFISSSGTSHPVRQIHVPYGIPIISIDIAPDWPETKMFIENGMVEGGLKGLRGSAEYEKLIGKLGISTSSIEALSVNHLYLIALILIGNIQYIYSRIKEKNGDVNGV